VSVTNTTDKLLPDVRIIDGVPPALAVDSGIPRLGTTLRPGDRAEFSYTITARRGVHEFEPTHVITRTLTGGIETERLVESDTSLKCVPPLSGLTVPVPLRQTATRFVGRQNVPTTGEGTEFSATREYRPGDPLRRIDWNRFARARELTTVEFREDRAAKVVILIDARSSAYVAPTSGEPHAVERSVDAAGQLYVRLVDAGNRVGLAIAGSESGWLAPGMGSDHRTAARELLAVAPELSPIPPNDRSPTWGWQRTLRERVDPGTQLLYLTPLADEAATRYARRFDEHDLPVTVISPNPTSAALPSHRLAGVVRNLRVSSLRESGIPVVEWPWTESIDATVTRYAARRTQ
jgi:uncharacterized protein (DUF58 family)